MSRVVLAVGGLISAAGLVLFLFGDSAAAITIHGYFVDDNGSIFEADIDAIAEAGITKGCNPPANTRYCPNLTVDRGAMAAFIRRALDLPAAGRDHFTDDERSIFEADINAIAEAGITRGCNPPANTLYCVADPVDRGAMAAFLRRGLSLPAVILAIPMSDHDGISCSKDGQRCSLVVDLTADRTYRVEEGVFQVLPASSTELSALTGATTGFDLTLNGSERPGEEIAPFDSGGIRYRLWRHAISFPEGSHDLVGTWTWDGERMRRLAVTVRADR